MKKKLAELIEMLCYDASGDEDERYIWRTIKKADSEGNGRRIKIDTETGKIVMGFGAGHTLAEAFKPKSEKIKEKLKKSVIQNRDRSSASSREQIRQISINPDYDRLGTSKTFTDGSPVVAFGKIPSKAYGKETRIVDSEGKKYTVKYAVIEADNLISSHDEQGFVNKEYGDTNNLDSVRAIAGNGRTAGIKSAYAKGNADEYKAELLKDTDHGVDPEYIKGLKNPVLVRVMNVDDVSSDIGDKTNTSNVMSYSNIDRANTDLARIEKVKLETDDNGDLTYNGVKQFVESLPQVEQSQYYNAKGELNKQAQERAYMALFKQAYTNNELFNKAFESLSNRTTLNLMTALKNASPSVANLKGLSDGYDARDLITQGCIKYIKGTENTTASGQADMFLSDTDNQITDTIAKELAMRSRSPGKMERFLVSIAQNLRKEAEKQDDMFGQAERFDVKSVVNKSMAVDSCLQTMSAEQREIWDKYGHDYIRELAADSVKPETEGRFFKMLNKMRRNPDLAGLVKAVDIARAYYKGVAFAKGMKTAQGNSLAEDTMEDGFVTLTDKNGNQYVAQCGTEEKERYKKTGKPLSKVNKEKKEAKEKQPEEKQSNRDDVIKYFTQKGLKPWRDERVYLKDLAKELLNLDTDYYKTGNLHSFSWYDGRESNTRGRKILKAIDSSYFDLNNGKVVVPYSRFEYEDDIADQVRNKYSEALTERLGKIDVTKRAEPEKVKPSDTTGKKSLDIETYTEKLRQRVNTKSAIGESEYLREKLQPLREKALEYIEKNKPTKEQYLEWFEKSGLKAEAIKIKAGEKQLDDKFGKGWNYKIYKYKDGTKAVFLNNEKIVLNDEEYNYLKDKATN